MAEGGEKTEKPTQKKIKDARNKGQVIQSTEIVTGLEMAAILAFFLAFGHPFLQASMHFIDVSIASINLDFKVATDLVYGEFMVLFGKYIGGLGLVLVIVIILGHVFQTGPVWASEAVEFKFDKLNIVNNAKQLFSMKSIFELLKNIFKVFVLSIVFYYILHKYANSFQYLPICNEECGLKVMMTLILWLWGCFVACYLLFGAADYAFQRYTTMEELKMTKEETKQEQKDTEGNPEIKQKRRETQREVASGSLASNVKKSSAVVRNPNHLAVCILYDAEEAPIPKVLEKAEDHMALHIVSLAEKNEIPVVENIGLARSLYAQVEAGDFVPESLFEPVAELLRFVMSVDYDEDEDEDDEEVLDKEETNGLEDDDSPDTEESTASEIDGQENTTESDDSD
ncbi:EscU/YscU/HrcU family type III secretion system export apparatus switch protein [Parashewanella spongiae]|uniref:EscU/YscU/HrcU family type III secretion system export apparatus switch protein n=1 Tax=Parashewanella spongiae TaxID=342950 RepID=A0A3A6U831_9GAMM|nr:EscU/YscU/HrcU family type III secretion system export apparatus switch protein [Parashewanella spongiae]MCL1077856.1 EscU/YscU/HrcU family type III secretion system export apparatus switch protein [Parashewanella spongiae]RJY17624.1 EscU/YscU/HrcU family type III secretion system export apparatus switch protein [Parashewanella spongiae]